jgi:hypothetical protein
MKRTKAEKDTKGSNTSPLFMYLDSITYSKKDLMGSECSEKDYVPFIINKGLSLYEDTIYYANLMNIHNNASKRMHYDFYLNSIRQRKRYSKWPKFEPTENYRIISEYYKYNHERTLEALKILSEEQIDEIKKKLEKGGIK